MFLKLLFCFSAVMLLATSSPAIAEDAQLSDSARQHIDSAISSECKTNTPGAVVTLIDKNAVIYQKFAGLADLERHQPLGPDSIFDLASVSKHFTAVAVMMLADQGKLSFSDDIAKYLPEFGKDAHCTIADLLHMTSGLADWRDFEQDTDMTNVGIVQLAATKPRNFATGTDFKYCNTNYVLLANIVSRISGMPFHEFMKKQIFDPLGMKNTLVFAHPKQVVPNRVSGYEYEGGKFEPSRIDTSLVGHSHVMTNTADIAIWLDALDQNTLVKPETMKLAYTSGSLNNGERTGYGFGWYVREEDGHRLVHHDGSWSGTATYIKRDLTTRTSIVVLSNNESLEVRDLAGKIIAIVENEAE